MHLCGGNAGPSTICQSLISCSPLSLRPWRPSPRPWPRLRAGRGRRQLLPRGPSPAPPRTRLPPPARPQRRRSRLPSTRRSRRGAECRATIRGLPRSHRTVPAWMPSLSSLWVPVVAVIVDGVPVIIVQDLLLLGEPELSRHGGDFVGGQ